MNMEKFDKICEDAVNGNGKSLRNDFDERQKLERGKCFQYAYFSALIILLIICFLEEVIEIPIKAEPMTILYLVLWPSVSVFAIRAIIKDAFLGIYSNGYMIFGVIWGFVGLFLTTILAIGFINGTDFLVENDTLTNDFRTLLTAIAMLIISIAYWIKRHANKKREALENELDD